MRGGKSSVRTTIATRGARRRPCASTGEIAEGFSLPPGPGVMFSLGAGFMQPVDASGVGALVFDARGGGTCQAMAFGESLGMQPAAAPFEAGEEWTRIEIPLSSFGGLDPAGASAFFIGGPTELGDFWLEIDNVELVE